jgi:hypothetical protein
MTPRGAHQERELAAEGQFDERGNNLFLPAALMRMSWGYNARKHHCASLVTRHQTEFRLRRSRANLKSRKIGSRKAGINGSNMRAQVFHYITDAQLVGPSEIEPLSERWSQRR